MPKQVWKDGVLSIELDANDPQDAAVMAIRGGKGKSLKSMSTPELVALLEALNTKYGLGLLP